MVAPTSKFIEVKKIFLSESTRATSTALKSLNLSIWASTHRNQLEFFLLTNGEILMNGERDPDERWDPDKWRGYHLVQRGRRWWWFTRICQRFWITNWGCPIAGPGLSRRPGPWVPVTGPDTVIEGGKTLKGSSEVKAGQEEKSSSGHQLQSTSSTGFSSSLSSSLSLEGSSSER